MDMTQDMTKDTTLHTIAKRMMLLLLMMTLGVGIVWGQEKYVYVANGHYMAHCGSGVTLTEPQAVTAPTAFNPNTCLWERETTSSGLLRAYGTDYYLNASAATAGAYYNAMVSTTSATIDDAGSAPYIQQTSLLDPATEGTPPHYYCYHATNGWIAAENAAGSPYGETTAPTVKTLTKKTSYEAGAKLYIDCPDVIGTDGAEPSVTASSSAKEFTHFVFDGTENHYWYDDADHTTPPTITPLECTSPTWEITSGGEYASIDQSTGVITVIKQTDENKTLTIKCSATVVVDETSTSISTTKTVTLRGGYYVFITSDGKYVTKAATGHGTSDTFNADNAVWESESAVEASEYETRYPITLIERKNITTVSAKINENYSDFTLTGKTYTFTASPTVGDNYYREYTINGTKHYWYNNADHATLPDYSWGDISTSNLTRSWSIETNTYATIDAQGVLSINSLPDSRTPLTVTCTISYGTKTLTASKKVYLNKAETEIHSLAGITKVDGSYRLASDFKTEGTAWVDGIENGTEIGTSTTPFTGSINGGMETIIGKWDKPLFDYVENATIKNVIIKNNNETPITISGREGGNANVGAIAGTAKGTSRIYNCGILPYSTQRNVNGKITGFTGISIGGDGAVGSIVGKIEGNARVINCFSYATVTSGSPAAGIVGDIGYAANSSITQANYSTVGMVVNCMFYGEVSGGSQIAPVYGAAADGLMIKNDATNGVNPYCYFRGDATFNNTTNFGTIEKYKRSWPADEEYLTRFEYYRSILNSNRKLCTWWVNGTANTAPTDADIENVGIAKWVLDPSMAPYPVLKVWGKYPSIINPDPDKTWNPKANGGVGGWQSRSSAEPYYGKKLGTLSVTVNPGANAAGGAETKNISLTITDIDRANHDYGYYKVQLPYYNELFGDPTVVIDPNATAEEKTAQWNSRYGGNYKANVVTGWKITSMDKSGKNSFVADPESGYNFADRECTEKDLFEKSGRVFAQGGFFYVPEGVTAINIEAKWGKAVYLHNNGHYIDRVNITNQTANGTLKLGNPFIPTGTLETTFQGETVWDDWNTAITKLDQATKSGTGANEKLDKTVYDQAIVLLSNFQLRNENAAIGVKNNSGKWYPYTIMSIDENLDNEPDYCFEFQYRREWNRDGIQPIRFDFLPVPELGLAVRHNEQQNTIGIFVPEGHFEITETSFMHTTQFEYDGNKNNNTITKIPAPIILNGGHFEQIIVRYKPFNNTQYFLMGGHFRMLRFTPGAHANTDANSTIVHLCPVNCIGGEYPEYYMSGIYNISTNPTLEVQGNPHCYTNGGYFGMMAGSGYEQVMGDVTFKIDHSIIDEFYGGGINGSKPVQGGIDVTIDHSLVTKYCGGPKVGVMVSGKKVETHATGTTFTHYYGGGNGGTSYYREKKQDGNVSFTNPSTETYWNQYGYNKFNPLNTISDVDKSYQGTGANKGYHAKFEFECFVESNGIGANPTIRSYLHWAQFGKTSTGNITNILKDCIFENDFYGGGNLGNVNGDVKSTLTNCTVNGNVFGGGYSGKIEPFRIHDKSATEYPYIDKAGVMQKGNGVFHYVKNTDGSDRYYTWCYRKSTTEFLPEGVTIPNTASTNNPTFQGSDGNWYVLTTESLENLGSISGDVELTLNGNTTVGTATDATSGNVFGGGNESAVEGSTTVTLSGKTRVLGNVFGGGNQGLVTGSATVNIE